MSSLVVCTACGTAFNVVRNDVFVEELKDGKSVAVFKADVWACPRCKRSILRGFGAPVREHFEGGYAKFMDTVRPKFKFERRFS